MEKRNFKNPKNYNSNNYNDVFYKCYSVKLNEFLQQNNLFPVNEKRHSKTNKIAFIYEKNKKLDELLTKWSKNRENVNNDR